MRSPAEMGLEEIDGFLDMLAEARVGVELRKMYVAGIKFLYGITLDRPKVAEKIPWPKVPHKLPDILSARKPPNRTAGSGHSYARTTDSDSGLPRAATRVQGRGQCGRGE
jgi:hypothetical protein